MIFYKSGHMALRATLKSLHEAHSSKLDGFLADFFLAALAMTT
jgi:hypothetical protein